MCPYVATHVRWLKIAVNLNMSTYELLTTCILHNDLKTWWFCLALSSSQQAETKSAKISHLKEWTLLTKLNCTLIFCPPELVNLVLFARNRLAFAGVYCRGHVHTLRWLIFIHVVRYVAHLSLELNLSSNTGFCTWNQTSAISLSINYLSKRKIHHLTSSLAANDTHYYGDTRISEQSKHAERYSE